MKSIVLADTGGLPSIADQCIANQSLTRTGEILMMNYKAQPAKVGSYIKTYIVSNLLPQVILQEDATIIHWKQKNIVFFTLSSALLNLHSLLSILLAIMFYTEQKCDFYAICLYSSVLNIYHLSGLNLISFDKLDRYMEALCL